jgi:hypothetical protein
MSRQSPTSDACIADISFAAAAEVVAHAVIADGAIARLSSPIQSAITDPVLADL